MTPREHPLSLVASLLAALTAGCESLPADADNQPDGAAYTGPACTSGTYWALGDTGSYEMHPGWACINCHTTQHSGPHFQLAGTLYTGNNEAYDCDGFPGTDTPESQHGEVEVTDATGTTVVITANNVGNFYTNVPLQFPLHVQVLRPGGTPIEMPFLAPNGDCNGCHTRSGTTNDPAALSTPATGRITL